MILSDLPVEILAEIATYVDDITVVRAVAKSCRQLHAGFNDRLYRCRWNDAVVWAIENGQLQTLRRAISADRKRLHIGVLSFACGHPDARLVEEILRHQGMTEEFVMSAYEKECPHQQMNDEFYARFHKIPVYQKVCPLLNASRMGLVDAVKLLLNVPGVDVGRRSGPKRETALHGAASKGDIDIINLLVSAGARVDARRGDDTTPLTSAVKCGHYAAMVLLQQLGADVDANLPAKTTPLMEAVRGGDADMVKFLIEHGANVSRRVLGSTSLHASLCRDLFGIADELYKHGADINAEQGYGVTSLKYAADAKKLRMCRFLLDRGATLGNDFESRAALVRSAAACQDVELLRRIYSLARAEEATETKYTGLLHVCTEPDGLQFLLESGVCAINELNGQGETPLISHIKYPSVKSCTAINTVEKCTRLLLQFGADPSVIDSSGCSAILYAIGRYDCCRLAQMLLVAGASTSYTERGLSMCNLLYEAATKWSCRHATEFAQYLIDRGLDVNQTNGSGSSPIVAACEGRNVELLQLLLSNGASCTAFNYGREHSLLRYILSTIDQHEENARVLACVRLLLEAGANPNETTHRLLTPLQVAVLTDQEELTELFLKYGGDVNVYSGFSSYPLCEIGFPLLHGVVYFDVCLSIAKMLIEHGADVCTPDSNGLTFMDWALGIGLSETLRHELLDISPKMVNMSFGSSESLSLIRGDQYNELWESRKTMSRRRRDLSLEYRPNPGNQYLTQTANPSQTVSTD